MKINLFKKKIIFGVLSVWPVLVLGFEIPPKDAWAERGVVLKPSSSGWDKKDGDGFTVSSVVKKNGTFYMYYQGAPRERSTKDGPTSVDAETHLSTSTDGFKLEDQGMVIPRIGGTPFL